MVKTLATVGVLFLSAIMYVCAYVYTGNMRADGRTDGWVDGWEEGWRDGSASRGLCAEMNASQTSLIRVSLICMPHSPNTVPGILFYHVLFAMIQ